MCNLHASSSSHFSKNIKTLRNDISSFTNSAYSNINNLTQKVLKEINSKENQDLTQNINELNKNQIILNSTMIAQVHNIDMLKQHFQDLLG